MSKILVTGARGNVGGRVVATLAKAGHRVRALVRDPTKAKLDPAVEVVAGTYDDATALRRALEGVTSALFITAGPEIGRHDGALAGAAKEVGARVVKLSIYAAGIDGPEIRAWHKAGEEQIIAAGLAWTFLRPGPFASNALRWLPSLRGAGKAYGAFGDAPLPVIDPEDIADVAALALTSPGHESKSYDLTGPEALTAAQQVEILSDIVDKPFTYINVDDEVAVRGMTDAGMPKPAATAMLHLVQAVRAAPPHVSDVVPRLLGRPARTFRHWVEANKEEFR